MLGMGYGEVKVSVGLENICDEGEPNDELSFTTINSLSED
jgi:hypothetical protein